MRTLAHFREQAAFLRQSSGSINLEKTLLKAVKVLSRFNIPHFVCGGFAVQERGYPRFTVDVDIIVPDVAVAIEKLSMNGFVANHGPKATVTDSETNADAHILPGGQKVISGPLALPMPTRVSDESQILTLEKLISGKLSTYIGGSMDRVQDYADVVQLMKVNKAPRDLAVETEVRAEYHRIWDELHQNHTN
jgi:hypothetical protein